MILGPILALLLSVFLVSAILTLVIIGSATILGVIISLLILLVGTIISIVKFFANGLSKGKWEWKSYGTIWAISYLKHEKIIK